MVGKLQVAPWLPIDNIWGNMDTPNAPFPPNHYIVHNMDSIYGTSISSYRNTSSIFPQHIPF